MRRAFVATLLAAAVMLSFPAIGRAGGKVQTGVTIRPVGKKIPEGGLAGRQQWWQSRHSGKIQTGKKTPVKVTPVKKKIGEGGLAGRQHWWQVRHR